MPKVEIDYGTVLSLTHRAKEILNWKNIQIKYAELKASIFETAGWNPFKNSALFKRRLKLLTELSKLIVKAIEAVHIGFGKNTSTEERLVAASRLLDNLVIFPWYIEWADDFLFYIVISIAVYSVKDSWGKDWTKNLIKEFGLRLTGGSSWPK